MPHTRVTSSGQGQNCRPFSTDLSTSLFSLSEISYLWKEVPKTSLTLGLYSSEKGKVQMCLLYQSEVWYFNLIYQSFIGTYGTFCYLKNRLPGSMLATFNSAQVQSANLQDKTWKECWFVNCFCRWKGCNCIHKYKFPAVFPKEVALSVTAAECGWKEV